MGRKRRENETVAKEKWDQIVFFFLLRQKKS